MSALEVVWIIGLLVLVFVMWKIWDGGRKEAAVQGLKGLEDQEIPVTNYFPIECMAAGGCDAALTPDTVHTINDVTVGRLMGEPLAPGEGTSVSSEWCHVHCPGGCDREQQGASA